jgi:hypothetical protein
MVATFLLQDRGQWLRLMKNPSPFFEAPFRTKRKIFFCGENCATHWSNGVYSNSNF